MAKLLDDLRNFLIAASETHFVGCEWDRGQHCVCLKSEADALLVRMDRDS